MIIFDCSMYHGMAVGWRVLQQYPLCTKCGGHANDVWSTFAGDVRRGEATVHLCEPDHQVVCNNCGHKSDMFQFVCGGGIVKHVSASAPQTISV